MSLSHIGWGWRQLKRYPLWTFPHVVALLPGAIQGFGIRPEINAQGLHIVPTRLGERPDRARRLGRGIEIAAMRMGRKERGIGLDEDAICRRERRRFAQPRHREGRR